MTESLADLIRDYRCTADHNDRLFAHLGRLADGDPELKAHRDFVEANAWGMGYRPFHYMWLLILKDCAARFGDLSAMEIGVHKGQVTSLWGLIAKRLGIAVDITAVSPFAGNQPKLRIVRSFLKRFSKTYRARRAAGSLYYDEDFLGATREIYERFVGGFDKVRIVKGLSTDPAVRAKVADRAFHVVYIDGDHSYESVKSDIHWYAPLVVPGGYLVMDDAAHFLPGETFHKGYESVSRACDDFVPGMGFANVLNVGHNRVFRRQER